MVDMSSHVGLRGLASVWVMIFHFLVFGKRPIDMQGSSLMPLFFMLSGFSLTIAYGSQASSGLFEKKYNFYRNRLARVYPVYIICIFFAVPLWWYGYGDGHGVVWFISSMVVSIFPLCTFFCFLLGGCMDGPGWTVCTLILMWFWFPFSLPSIKKMSDADLLRGISQAHYWQLGLLFVLFFLLIGLVGFWPAFAAATMHPITRYPLFLMGAYAAELCARHEYSDLAKLWHRCTFCCPCSCYDVGNGHISVSEEVAAVPNDVPQWADTATMRSVLLLLSTALVTLIDAIVKYTSDSPYGTGVLGAVWFQAIIPFMQLELIVALTRDNGSSLVSRFLRSSVMSWLGKRSMCLYLVHYPVMMYTNWILTGHRLHWPEPCDNYDDDNSKLEQCEHEWDEFASARRLPLWAVPLTAAAAIILAALLYEVIEKPGRQLFNSRRESHSCETELPVDVTIFYN